MEKYSSSVDIYRAFEALRSNEIRRIYSIKYEKLNSKSHFTSVECNGKISWGQGSPPEEPLVEPNPILICTVLLPDVYSLESLAKLPLFMENISKVKTLSNPNESIKALEFEFQRVKNSAEISDFSLEFNVDLIIQENKITRKKKRLFVFDMDSTLIHQECIDELAKKAGCFNKIAPITERAMRGEIDFNESLKERVALLKGQPESIITDVQNIIEFKPGLCFLMRCQRID